MAFPSVPHYWLVFVLNLIGLEGLLDAILSLYRVNKVYMDTRNGVVFMFSVLSGVLQGCPLSGSVFVVAFDPVWHMFRIHLGNPFVAWVGACANDIGMALSQLRHLPIV